MSGTENEVNGELRTGIVSGLTFVNRPVKYYDVDGIALFEGDINLGTTEDVEQQTAACMNSGAAQNVTTVPDLRWPNGVVPFEIDAGLPNQQAVLDAIAHVQDHTVVRFAARSGEADYVRFVPHPSVNDSRIGRVGGEQEIRLTGGFIRGTVVHEILHCLGVWHEQSRADRDQFIRIQWENILPDKVSNFDQHVNDNHDVGAYDYGSIMHYPRDAFSRGGDTIVPLDPNAQIGQRDGLSPLDVEAVRFLYAPWALAKPPTTTVPDLTGLDVAGVINSLGAAGLQARWFYEYSATAAQGTVIRQDVAAGIEWPSGAPIPVTISLGSDPDPHLRVEPINLGIEDTDQCAPEAGQLTPTLVTQLEQILSTLTSANLIHALSPADKECWAGIAAVYARLVARVQASST